MKRPGRRTRLDKGLRGWIHNTAKKNYWRVAAWYDLEDVIQEGYVCYARCHAKYPMTLTQPHFCALVKTTFTNELHDIAKRTTRQIDAPLCYDAARSDKTLEESLEALAPEQPEESSLAALISQMPAEIRDMLKALLEDAQYTPTLKVNGVRETTSAYLWRLIGKKPNGIDVYAMLKSQLTTG